MTRHVQPISGALRAFNRAQVVRVLRHAGWATRAELVAHTGLSRATVSSVVGELIDRGLIAQRSVPPTGGRGRPATEIGLDKTAGTAIAVDIGVRHVAVAVGDLAHSVLAEQWVSAPRWHTSTQGTRIVLRCIEEALDQAGVDCEQLVGAAISIAAPVTSDGGRLAVPDVLPGWNGSALAGQVAARWGIPVVTENDANLGALGEAVSRPPEGDGDLLFVKVASRIGLGIARDRRIVRGRRGYAGEFGHVPARTGGDRCWCGRRGCLELYAGGEGMLRRLSGADAVNSMTELIATAATSPAVRRVVTDGVTLLARAISGLAIALDPARIVLGGEMTGLGDLLERPIRHELQSLPFGAPVELAVSPLGHRASLVGALSLVLTEPVRFTDHAQGTRPALQIPRPYPQSPLATTSTQGVHV